MEFTRNPCLEEMSGRKKFSAVCGKNSSWNWTLATGGVVYRFGGRDVIFSHVSIEHLHYFLRVLSARRIFLCAMGGHRKFYVATT